jgi:putative transposase
VIPFLAFPPTIRRVIYTTNAIESINAQLRKIIKSRGRLPAGRWRSVSDSHLRVGA